MNDELLTVMQVATYLKVTRQTVYGLINNKINPLPVIRTIGKGSPRISSEQLKAWVAGVYEVKEGEE
jgi:excisionase family DNA binding protein